MADFVAVIKRAVDNLSDDSVAMRTRVYEKARAAVRRQLENVSPRPSEQAIEAQLSKLEDAIASVEASYAEAEVETSAAEVIETEREAGLEPAEAVSGSEPEPALEGEREAEATPAPESAPVPDWESQTPAAVDPMPQSEERDAAAQDAGDRADAREATAETLAPEPEPTTQAERAPEPAPAPEPVAAVDIAEPTVSRAGEDDGRDAAQARPASGPAPVPFGSYALGRAPSFPMPPRRDEQPPEPPAQAGAFTPSRYQAGFTKQATPAPEPDAPGTAGAEDQAGPLPAPEPVAATQLVTSEPVSIGSAPAVPETAAEAIEPAASADPEAPDTPPAIDPTLMPGEAELAAADRSDDADPSDRRIEVPDDPFGAEAIFAEELRRAEAEEQSPQGVSSSPGDESDSATRPPADDHDETFGFTGDAEPVAERPDTTVRRRRKPLVRKSPPAWRRKAVVGGVVVLLLAGAGAAAFLNRDTILALTTDAGAPSDETASSSQDDDEAPVAVDGEGEEQAAIVIDQGPDAGSETGAQAPASEASEPAGEGVPVEKFTQRLLPDGREVDEGPAEDPGIEAGEEGQSLTLQSDADETTPEDDESETAVATEETAEEAAETTDLLPDPEIGPIVDGETALLYEERLGQRGPNALEGQVAWSMVQESPGDDAPPEETIRGELSVPNKDLSGLITIRRNIDTSLPASHLIEIVFSVPATFEGGGIESVQRVAFKENEQDRGDELIAVSAKITDEFFMIALNDYAEAVTANVELMRERDWIDIPVVYGNGRRALLTLHKGAEGAEIFNEALTAWDRRGGSAG